LKTLVTRPDPLFAPLAKHQPVANLKVMLDQAPLTEIPLLALSQVDEAGFFGRTWDALTLWLK
jgi:D-alanyl-D-alanine carboxypeptidase (penicillin-binding protein 5/6)